MLQTTTPSTLTTERGTRHRFGWLFLAAAFAVVLAVLAVELRVSPGLRHWDARALRALPHPHGWERLTLTTIRGDAQPGFVAAWALVLATAWSVGFRTRRPILIVSGALVGVAALVVALKVGVDRLPPGRMSIGHLGGSFPSGHTAMALVATGAFAVAAWPVLRPWWRLALLVLSAAATLAVGSAMVLLQSHWPLDTVGSVAAAGLVLAVTAGVSALVSPAAAGP